MQFLKQEYVVIDKQRARIDNQVRTHEVRASRFSTLLVETIK